MMKRLLYVPLVMLLAVAQSVSAADTVDIRRGAPEDVFLVVYGKHNPERDFQQQYYEEVWKTVQETQIVDRIVKIVTSRMKDEDLDKAKAVVDELRGAVEPIDLKGLAAAQEIVYAQQMIMAPMPTSQHLVVARLTPEVAKSTVDGITNLFGLVEKYTDGQIPVVETKEGEVKIFTLGLPAPAPYQPTVAQLGEVFVFCTSQELLEKSLKMLTGGEGKSKFDDPRLAEALKQLPEAEDSVVFYDGKTQFETLRGLGSFIQSVGGGDPNVDRVVKILDKVWDDVAILDYEVTVEYTEGNLNRSASFGKLLPGTGESTLRKMLESGQPFEKWGGWVPSGSLSYAMGTGVNLHPLYERIMTILKEDVPESAEGLKQLEQIQQQINLHLDADILQAFSGEHVSVSMPSGKPAGNDWVLALRCSKPEKIKELIHRAVTELQKIKQVQAQQLKLVESKDLPGFEEISAATMMVFGVKPVFGFQDGWMFVGANAAAVKKVLETQAGKGESIEGTEAFQKLKLDIQGPVQSIAYTNTAESVRGVAKALESAGMFVPMIIGMAGGGNANKEELKVLQEALALLPDVGKIIGKFDFLEANVTVVQAGSEPDTYTKRSVTVVRAPEASKAEAEQK